MRQAGAGRTTVDEKDRLWQTRGSEGFRFRFAPEVILRSQKGGREAPFLLSRRREEPQIFGEGNECSGKRNSQRFGPTWRVSDNWQRT